MSALRKLYRGLLWIVGLCSLGISSPLDAHPFHTTTAEMEYNRETGRLEITLRVPASDLEEALTRQAARALKAEAILGGAGQDGQPGRRSQRIKLEATPQVERLITDYLKSRFFITTPGNEEAAGERVGRSGQRPLDKRLDAEPLDNETLPAAVPGPLGSPAARPATSLRWVGMELDRVTAWLYFELELPSDDKLSLVNQLFFELNSQQINTCTLRVDGARFSLRTDERQPQVALPPQARSR